jgi:tetratricopeptide (TPR) repeat protein
MKFTNQQIAVSTNERVFAAQLQQEVDHAAQQLQQGNAELAVALFQRALQKTPISFPGYDLITHNLLVACKRRIEQLLPSGDHAGTTPYIRIVLGLQLRAPMAQDREFRTSFADSIHALGNAYFDHYQFEAAAQCFRKALSIELCPTYHTNLSNALAALGQPGKLSDYAPALAPNRLGQHFFIACMPKSGSTFLKNVLCQVTGYEDRYFFYAHGQNEHDLYLPNVLRFSEQNTVTQQHSRASHANVQMMQAFNIRPVVLTRNIFDAMVSLLDFYKNGAAINTYHQRDFEQMNDEQRMDLIIDYYAPWYFQFFASWLEVEAKRRLPVMWLSYEDLIADKPLTIERVLKFYGSRVKREVIQRAIATVETDAHKNRFNKGVAGRGQASLSQEQKARINALTRHYLSTDFSRIGL